MNPYVRPLEPEDIYIVGKNLRTQDNQECMYSCGMQKEEALFISVAASDQVWTVINPQGQPVAICGVRSIGECGIPWLLGTDGIYGMASEFLKFTQDVVNDMAEGHAYLTNFVYYKNHKAIDWLRKAGFEMCYVDAEFGVAEKPFINFVRYT